MKNTVSSDIEYIDSVASGYRLSQVLYVFAQLGIADLLADAPATHWELAKHTGTAVDSLRRLLRVACTMGLIEDAPDERFQLTIRGGLLRSDLDGSLRPRARSSGEPWQWAPWGRLLDVVRTGRSAFGLTHGSNSFDFFDQTPGAGDTLMSRMTVESKRRGQAIADAFDFGMVQRVVDVGGGQGGVLGEILSRHPKLTGILVDLSYAVNGSAQVLTQLGVDDRCQVVAMDFRNGVPAGGDVYLLSAVLHSWNDLDSARLLERCFEHADRVLIVDEVIETSELSTELLLKDLQLMVFSEGRQRRLEEYRSIIEHAGGALAQYVGVGNRELLMCAMRRARDSV
ncbi:MAG TPA: methyltransferase [Thermoanaerobaculia bacterium]|nr:methyltransferase [Thermoanaerobaculia bacterium]